MTMAQDNQKAKQTQAVGPLRMQQAPQLEKDVCALAIKLADRVAQRVHSMNMRDIPLPLDYMVRAAELQGKAGLWLVKMGEETPYCVNDPNPIVEVSLQFYRDCNDGLLNKIEEAYRKRQAEFAAAKELFGKELERGVKAFTTGQGEPEFNRFQSIETGQ